MRLDAMHRRDDPPRETDHLFVFQPTSYTPRPVAARRLPDPRLASSPRTIRSRPSARPFATGSTRRLPTPTAAQVGGWAAIAAGQHTLIHAPTGSGKTLAAFLWCLDRLVRDPSPPPTREQPGAVRILYVSPLKALSYDVERNLRAPLAGIALAAGRRGDPVPEHLGRPAHRRHARPTSGAPDRRRPPDILITTPESLYLLLTSAAREIAARRRARDRRRDPRDRRLEARRPPRAEPRAPRAADDRSRPSGSASRRPSGRSRRSRGSWAARARAARSRIVDVGLAQAARALGRRAGRGHEPPRRVGPARGAAVGRPGPARRPRVSIWPSIHPRILELIRAHRSTIVFCNSRRLAERLAQRLNELAGEELVRAHHGSIAREQRLAIEDDLKSGRLPAIVATSSLELGIDMGAVDLVIQVESPTSVARGLQRIGRAGHQVDSPSRRGDLPEVPRRPARGRGRRRADARGRRSRRP